MYRVKEFFDRHAKKLALELVAGRSGFNKVIRVPEAQRPGISLSGYLKSHAAKRMLVFGKVEMEYLRDLVPSVRLERLQAIITEKTPAIILSRRYFPLKEIRFIAEKLSIPLFRSKMVTMSLLSKLLILLSDDFAPSMSCHGALVEVFGVGVMILGDSAVGKSEAALGLIERGHRLISDDVVKIKKKEESYLEGAGVNLTKHHMEIRGIGIINVAYLHGADCVRDRVNIDIVVKLEAWQDDQFYDRVGLDEESITILDIKRPYHRLPVKPGRNVVLLLETLALNHRLKGMGYNSAQEFSEKVLELTMSKGKMDRSNFKSMFSPSRGVKV
jgi:HPr kinase/phosphorylase